MIETFEHKGLEAFFQTGKARKLPAQNVQRVARMFRALDRAARPQSADLPRYRFHVLKGDRRGTFSIWVSGNWRMTFGWDGQDAIDVNMQDYH